MGKIVSIHILTNHTSLCDGKWYKYEYLICRFVDFMKNWTEHDKPEYMEISYFSERSVEDEIERESHTNVSIVIISYLAMVAYVALMLGNFHCSSKFLVILVIIF